MSEPFGSKPGDELTFRLEMVKGGWITGRVRDAEGRPVPEIMVSTVATDRMDLSYSNRIATTDKIGAFKVGPLRPGEYVIKAGTGQGAPIQEIPGTETKPVEVADGQQKSVEDLVLPARSAALQ